MKKLCSTCKFWKNIGNRKDFGTCEKGYSSDGNPEDITTLAYGYGYDIHDCAASLMTRPDFGCVMHQSKDKKPTKTKTKQGGIRK